MTQLRERDREVGPPLRSGLVTIVGAVLASAAAALAIAAALD
jgi:hypothetical protein